MRVKINGRMAEQFCKVHPNDDLSRTIRYNSPEKVFKFVFEDLTEAELDTLEKIATKEPGPLGLDMLKRIDNHRAISTNASGHKCHKLPELATALKEFLRKAPNHWCFEIDEEYLMPVYCTDIKFVPRDRRAGVTAHVRMQTKHMERGDIKQSTVTWDQRDLSGGLTPEQALNNEGLVFPTEKLLKKYEASMERYKAYQPLTGSQYTGTGDASTLEGRWHSQKTSLIREGVPDKLVMDDEHDEAQEYGDESPVINDDFWGARVEQDEESDEEDETNLKEVHSTVLPTHPFLKLFNLDRHQFVIANVDQITEYKWDTTLEHKLILPHAHKELIQVLMETASEDIDDIIRGKSGGTICICTGEPGTGKTLTAEVTSEVMQKPLYKVDCSQLGTDEEAIEKELTTVLNRATRWKALLLIDEADVYVRARDTDLQQNAIVGVFLRVLEYYRGVLFLTSNRATVIDDAIMSRATAHLRYQKPDKADLLLIWEILSKQFKFDLRAGLATELVETFPDIVGRDVKNLLKLVIRYSRRSSKKPDIAMFKLMAVHKDIPIFGSGGHPRGKSSVKD